MSKSEWENDDGPSFSKPGKFFKVGDNEQVDFVIVSDSMVRFRPSFESTDKSPYYVTPPASGEYDVKRCFEVYNLDAKMLQLWETSENNYRMCKTAIKAQMKRGAPASNVVQLRVTKTKAQRVSYAIVNIGVIDPATLSVIGQEQNRGDVELESIEGLYTPEEGMRLIEASKGKTSPDTSAPAAQPGTAPVPDEEIPF